MQSDRLKAGNNFIMIVAALTAHITTVDII
jgi:hypothetical protein